jgi:hypothetical protein
MKFELKTLDWVDYPFSVGKEYGRYLQSEDTDLSLKEFSDFVVAVLTADAKRTLPPNTPFEIRATIPSGFERYKAYCWIYQPAWDKEEISFDGKWRFIERLGVLRAGRFLT